MQSELLSKISLAVSSFLLLTVCHRNWVTMGVKCSLTALNAKQQKDVVIFNGKITMGFVPCLLQVL